VTGSTRRLEIADAASAATITIAITPIASTSKAIASWVAYVVTS